MAPIHRRPIYELAISARIGWQAHSLSNAGTNGSNRLLGRRQLLADGTETDACSGNIAKHHHSMLLAEYAHHHGLPLCSACARRDGRRAAALVGHDDEGERTIERVLQECVLCDTHGFLVTPKNASRKDGTEGRLGLSKGSLIEFSFALALPDQHTETSHLFTRIGDSKEDGQMLMKRPVRSGTYAVSVRYKCVGIGVDTYKWRLVLTDEDQRQQRHKSILAALRDQILSPSGALTATTLPHLTSLEGALVLRPRAGRAAMYSALKDDFIEQLMALPQDTYHVIPFRGIADFCAAMNGLINSSYPCLPVTSQPYRDPEVQQ